MFVELHILQNFAPSNLNRDDTNAPKDCEFGGYRRARISSQCLKRAIRWNDEFRRVLLGCGFATRTKWQANAIADEIRVVRGLPDDDKTALAVARFVIRRAGFKEKGDKTTVLLFLGQDEIDAVVKKINDHWIVIRQAADIDQKWEETANRVEKFIRDTNEARFTNREDWMARLSVDYLGGSKPAAADLEKIDTITKEQWALVVTAFQETDDAAFEKLDAILAPSEDSEQEEEETERVPAAAREWFKKISKKEKTFDKVKIALDNMKKYVSTTAASTTTTQGEDAKLLKTAIKAVVKTLLENGTTSVDIAMFARMIAEAKKGQMNITAACQVAHAISTNKAQMEFDFYTAVDELDPNGAGMMGVQELTSPCYYRYASIDVDQLYNNLLGKHCNRPEKASEDLKEQAEATKRKAIEAFIRASVDAIPSGKTAGTAPWNAPSLVMAVVRPHGVWSLANAFVVPVSPRDGFVQGSIKKLDEYWQTLNRMYGSKDIKSFVTTESPESIVHLKKSLVVAKEAISELDAVVEGVLGALQPRVTTLQPNKEGA